MSPGEARACSALAPSKHLASAPARDPTQARCSPVVAPDGTVLHVGNSPTCACNTGKCDLYAMHCTSGPLSSPVIIMGILMGILSVNTMAF